MASATKAEWAITRRIRLSKRYTVEMTAGPAGFTCEWEPEGPPAPGSGKLLRHEFETYRKARDELLAEVGRRMGGPVLMLDVGARGQVSGKIV